MVRTRTLLAWLFGGVTAAVIGFFAAEIFVSKTEPELQVLKTLAPFSLPTTSGDYFSSDQLSGQPVLVNFWATW
ncbi:MAG TPA: hypothetical protein DHW07_06495, partial [Gammaproteobacteria bacterium]|nr:hypothetical protein [Gammaproteobacteria bacterium]